MVKEYVNVEVHMWHVACVHVESESKNDACVRKDEVGLRPESKDDARRATDARRRKDEVGLRPESKDDARRAGRVDEVGSRPESKDDARSP